MGGRLNIEWKVNGWWIECQLPSPVAMNPSRMDTSIPPERWIEERGRGSGRLQLEPILSID